MCSFHLHAWPGAGAAGPFITRPPIPRDFFCPVLHEAMRNPMVASDGYSYEEAAIQQWCQRATDTDPAPGRARSHRLPMTNLELESLTLRPNIALRAVFFPAC